MKFLHDLIELKIEHEDGIKRKKKKILCALYSNINQKIAPELIIYETPLVSNLTYIYLMC